MVASLIPGPEPWLKRFLDCLDILDYPKGLVHYAFVEAQHVPLLHDWTKSKPNSWIRQANPEISNRYDKLAHLRNLVVDAHYHAALEGPDYLLWIDSDVVKVPPSLIKDLKKYDAPVIAPSVYIEGTSQFYDTFAFRYPSGQRFPAWGISHKGLIEVGSVGTCYMVASRLYSQSRLRYHGDDSEHATFCKQVRKLGERVYVDFNVKIEHANLPKWGKSFH